MDPRPEHHFDVPDRPLEMADVWRRAYIELYCAVTDVRPAWWSDWQRLLFERERIAQQLERDLRETLPSAGMEYSRARPLE